MQENLSIEIPLPKVHNFKNLTGQRYGRYTVISYAGKPNGKHTMWQCRCDCGIVKLVDSSALSRGKVVSCGCYNQEKRIQRTTVHGMSHTLTYSSWWNMINRCTRPHHRKYKFYGGRGIQVCDRWLNFENFFLDMGSRPSKAHTIDRIDPDGHYEPSNCRWASKLEQASNMRSNRRITFQGETLSMAEWARRMGLTYGTLEKRMRLKWSVADALTAPVDKKFSTNKK